MHIIVGSVTLAQFLCLFIKLKDPKLMTINSLNEDNLKTSEWKIPLNNEAPLGLKLLNTQELYHQSI